jgi:hypothetical protein
MPFHFSTHRRHGPCLVACTAVALWSTGCAVPHASVDAFESFDSSATFSRTYAAREAQACEAARRTLLSQGYVVSIATADQVRARKIFQPAPETHVEVEFNVVCAREGSAGARSIAFVSAIQERFALKKSRESASVGVGAFGSLSLPFTGSDDSLVKVASSTVTNARFYDRFFHLLERYLAGDPGQALSPAGEALDIEAPASAASQARSARSP